MCSSRRSSWCLLVLPLFSVIFAVGCGGEPAPDAPVAPRWAGRQLHLIVVDDPPLAEAAHRLAGEWQARSGATLSVQELDSATLLAGESLEADAVIYPSPLLGELVARDWLHPLSADWLSRPELNWGDVFEAVRTREATWGSATYAVPFGSPLLMAYYRADVFQQRRLRPPRTWREYQELLPALADPPQGLAQEEQATWSAALEPLAENWAGRTLLARAAASARHPHHYSTLFSIETMESRIDGPPFVRALEELVEAASFQSGEARRLAPDDVRREFWQGHCAVAITWPTATMEIDGLNASDNMTVGFFPLPGSEQRYDPSSEQWERRPEGESPRVPVWGLAGRLGSIASRTDEPEATLELLAMLCGEQWGTEVASASSQTTLYRESQLARAHAWVEPPMSQSAARQYATLLAEEATAETVLLAPRIPGQAEYLAALDAAVAAALDGTASPAEALTDASRRWDEITERHGRESQRAAYRRSLGLPP